MLLHQLERLPVDDRLHDRLQRLVDDLADAVARPAPRQLQDRLPDPLETLLARTEVEVDELRVESAYHGAAVHQPAVVERTAEGGHRRLGDDRLVEVEESRFAHVDPSDAADEGL